MLKLAREYIFKKWKVFEYGPDEYYIGPSHGRLAVSFYKTRLEAKAAIYMMEWLLKYLKIKN